MSTTSWFVPFAMLFLAPALTSAARSRTSASLLRLSSVQTSFAIAIAVATRTSRSGDMQWVGIFYMAALAALLLTGSLLGATVRYGIDRWGAGRGTTRVVVTLVLAPAVRVRLPGDMIAR